MPPITPYLSFDGNCAEAMRFYERVLNGKIEALLTHDQTPMKDQVPPGNGDRIMHARLLLDGGDLMAGDSLAGQPHSAMKGVALTLTYPTAAEAKSIFD